ncbi:unnamed protein product, partial [Polarella glacialis]
AVVAETAELRAAVQFQAQEASKVREAVEHLRAERSELEGRHASAQRDLEQLQKLKVSEQSALEELARLRQEADDLLQEKQQLQQSERRVRLGSEQRLKSMEDLQGRTCEEMESIQHEAAVVQQENRRLAAKVEASQAAFQGLEQQLRTAEAAELAKAKKLKEELRQERTERETLTVELEFERTRRESLTVDQKSVQAKLAVSEAEIAKLEKQRDELASDVGHLRNAQAQREEAETSLRAALKEAKIVNLELEQVLAEKEEALSRARLQANGLAFQERRVDCATSLAATGIGFGGSAGTGSKHKTVSFSPSRKLSDPFSPIASTALPPDSPSGGAPLLGTPRLGGASARRTFDPGPAAQVEVDLTEDADNEPTKRPQSFVDMVSEAGTVSPPRSETEPLAMWR